MPHLIRAADIPMEQRRPHMARYVAQLRKALADPSLGDRERTRLQGRLDRLLTDMRRYSEGH